MQLVQQLLLLLLLQGAAANSPPRLQVCTSLSASYVTLGTNDCATTSGNIRIKEEIPIGTNLIQFTATDPEKDPVSMSLVGNADALRLFSLTSFPGNSSAVLTASARLDAETFSNIFTEFDISIDDGKGNRLTTKFPVVVIDDVNDNRPTYEALPYRWEIPENTLLPNITFTVNAIDTDRSVGGMTIEFKEVSGSDISGIFNYSSVRSTPRCTSCTGRRYSRTISLLRPLDYEVSRFFQMSVNATDTLADGASSLTDIIINVIDKQDTPPFFEGIPYVRTVRENAAQGTHVVTLVAKDGDRGSRNPVRYSLDPKSPFSKYFQLDSSSGNLTISSVTLDREAADILAAFGTIDLPVVANEVSTVVQPSNISEARTTVRVIVADDNDFRPTFSQSVYNASVTENTEPGLPVTVTGRIVIRDLDSGSNGDFNVSVMRDGSPNSDFTVTPTQFEREGFVNLLVANKTLLDYERVKSVTFQLVAMETKTKENFATTATVSLTILDANDNRPLFNQTKYTFIVRENAPNGTAVGRVQASDRDSGRFGQISYSLSGTDAAKFRIDSTTGEIFVNVAADTNSTLLDRERFSTIFLTLQATDGGGLVTAAQLEVQLTDMNDHAPVFARSAYTAVLAENRDKFETDVVVQARDADESGSANSRITFSITSGDTGRNFNISADTGVVSVAKPLDFESLNSSVISITITASDQGEPSMNTSVQLTVTVLDQNDNAPKCSQAVYSASVIENATSGTEVITVNASDADSPGSVNSRVIFRIQSGAADKFSMDGDQGKILVERGANLDVNRFGSQYNLTVSVLDRGSPQLSGSCLVRITVRDVNNQRPFFPRASQREAVPESIGVGQPLPVSYSAQDPDSSARLQYSILTSQMRATATNGLQVIQSAYNYTNLFRIDPNNGTVFVNSKLDREQAEEIILPIFVRDLAAQTALPVQTATGTLIITLTDVNDEPPVFLPPAVNNTYNLTVQEDVTPPADISLKAIASDADKTGGRIQYSIQPSSSVFSIDPNTAQVSLKSLLDRELKAEHLFRVVANDSVFQSTATVTITVGDANDNAPVFKAFGNLTVSENARVGSVLTQLTATDADLGSFGEVNFRIVSGASGFFSINSSTGELSVAKPLDRDVPGGQSFSLVVEAYDNRGSAADSQRTAARLSITVTDVNDNAPRFSQANFTITSLQESMPQDQIVREIPATDADLGQNAEISFSLSAIAGQSSRALNLFKVATRRGRDSSYTAVLSTKTSLKNAVGWYNATLVATDNGAPKLTGSTNITFFISDVNDFSPEFLYPNTSETVLRVNESTNASSTVNKVLLTARATDRDFGNNSAIRFSLTSSSRDHLAFRIDAVSGVLTIAAALDRETQSVYRFQIRATDLGTPRLSSQVNIVIDVVDVDESPPVFNAAQRTQALSVNENVAAAAVIPGLSIRGVLIGRIAPARDPDATSSDTDVCYFVLNQMFNKFYLNRTTGDLYSLTSFDREVQAQYTLYIIAVSASFCSADTYVWSGAPKPVTSTRVKRSLDTTPVAYDPANPAMLSLTVTVNDVNDSPPRWSQSQFYGGVRVSDPPNTEIFNFANSVTDADAGNNSRLTFTITAPQASPDSFRKQLQEQNILANVLVIEARTGILRTGSGTYFQSLMAGSLSFNVTASDSKYSAVTQCTIYLLSLSQQIVVTIGETANNVTRNRDKLANYLSNITGWQIVVNSIVTHKRADGSADASKTDVFVHAVNRADNSIVPASTLRDRIDLLWTSIRVLYKDFGVLSVRLAVQNANQDPSLEVMRIALIVVACCLTVLLSAACISLWSCRKMYRRKLKAATAVAFGANGQTESMRLPGTNMHTFEGSNPIWRESAYDGLNNNNDNKAFESDKDSLDNNAIEPSIQRHQHQQQQQQESEVPVYDEVEKSLNFFDNDDRNDNGELVSSREILNSAVDAGPDLVKASGDDYRPANAAAMRDLPSTNI